jgi:osmoprotectant transport system permease protein
MRGRCFLALLMVAVGLGAPVRVDAASGGEPIAVGSKTFGESYLLGEIFARLLEAEGFVVERRFGLGGTLICTAALRAGEIDVYPEYTGTITQAILRADIPATEAAVATPLAGLGLRTLPALGFDNTYALAVDGDRAAREGLATVSDLRGRDDLAVAFSNEFLERDDGWPGLRAAYGLELAPAGVDHGLAYQAIAGGRIDVTDAYSTDGDLERYGLFVLEDDRAFFPSYLALPLARADLPPAAAAALSRLAGRIDEARMRGLNARVSVDGLGFDEVARDFLIEEGLVVAGGETRGRRSDFAANTLRHLQLTGVALLAAVLLGVPLGIFVHTSRQASRTVLYVASLLQTIPSIALLALLIPLLGIGVAPAVVALFLYSLLPILRATVTALLTVDPVLVRVAVGMGLSERQRVRHLLLPLAMPHVLAGVRTAAVISIGTATLAAFIGAGGLGQPIVTGLALNDPKLILQGAVPAAVLALLTELAFEFLERRLVPAHLRDDPLR